MEQKLKRDKVTRRDIRKFRARKKLNGNTERPRLVLTKTLKYLYAQIINDVENLTITGSSTLKIECKNGKNIESAIAFGKVVGNLLKEKGINKVVFDRNGYLYHGKVKAFADSVRESGIDFQF